MNPELKMTVAPINARKIIGGEVKLMYRYSVTASGRYRVSAIYTGLPTGCIGSGGKSFATAAERDAATEASIEKLQRKGWERVLV